MFYPWIARPLLFRLNPEFAHRSAIRLGRTIAASHFAQRLLRRIYSVQFPELEIRLFGLKFPNPIGLAAGFDKHGHIHSTIAALGFGHMEIGSISYQPWPGNPSPTLLRLPRDGGLINWLGLNSEGAVAVQRRLNNVRFNIPMGINLVKTADPRISGQAAIEDYLQCFGAFHSLADFITLNLSCPNTFEGQTFQDPAVLASFLRQLREYTTSLAENTPQKPILIKLSPDLDDAMLEALLEVANEYSVNGCVISNTTSHREKLKTPEKILQRFNSGGLSGRPLKPFVQAMVHKVYQRTKGQFPIVACGGIGCDPLEHPANEAWEYLKLGASLVQLHTGLIYRGPAIARIINTGLAGILKANRITNLSDWLAARDPKL